MEYERPPVLRGVHFGPGTSCGFDIGWWVQFLKSMHVGWIKIVDDAGSMMEFAAACRAAGIMPIIRLYRQYPYPGQVRAKDWVAFKEYIRRGITRWFEVSNEPNLWDPEWHPDYRPQRKEGDPAVYETPWFANTALPLMMDPWVVDAEYIISLGGYPAFPALAQCGFHPVCGSIPIARAMFNYLQEHYFERAKDIWENGGWLSVHDATLNHFYHDGQKWHFEYPYDPSCQSRHPGKTIMEDDNSLIGHEAPRDMITNRWGLRVPIISTEGGVFLDVGTQWDSNYPGISSAEYHGQATLGMFDWLDEYQKTHQWFFGMCPWIVAGQVLGHPIHWEAESWKKVDREEPVVRYLQGSPPRDLNLPVPTPQPEPIPAPQPTPEPPPAPSPEPSSQYKDFARPPGDNGLGIHFGLGDELVSAALEQGIARAKLMRFTWGTVAFGAGEDVMLAGAKKLWAAGIMPVVRKVLSIDGKYDFARDTRLLLSNGIPAYIQIFNEPSDEREWEKRPNDYMQRWAGLWAQKASEVVAAGGHPGIQCLHPPELFALFATLPKDSQIWKQAWFCSHNYGLNHPPSWKGDYWTVLGWETFAGMFQDFLGFVPPIICGEGGWLYKASDDDQFPPVLDDLHASYHKEMYDWFRTGRLSDGQPLPDYLFAVCPWILSGPSDEAWYGFTMRTKTIEAVKSIPPFVRGGGSMPTPEPQPQPEPTPVSPVEYAGLTQWMKDELVIEPALHPKQVHWRVKKIEVQPGTDNFSAFAITDKSQGATAALFFWPDGEVRAEFKADNYTIPEARQWAASMPMFNLWGSYGVTMLGDLGNSEVVRGTGLYQKEGDQIVKKTGHHPVLVYFERVEGVPEPEPEPEPQPEPQPAPQPPSEIPYTLERRLGQAPYGFEDLRAEIRKFSDVKALEATARRDAQGNPLFHLIEFMVVHNSGYDKPHTPMSTARQAVAEGEPTIEYHFCIQEGKLFWTAPLVWVTNQTYQFNSRSIGVCVLGNYENKDPDPRDLETLRFFIAAFEEFMGQGWGKSRPVGLVPHRYVVKNATACPGRIWPAVLWSGPWPILKAP